MSYGLQRRNAEAVQELERAIELDPNSALAFALLGLVRCWGGDGDGGIAAFDVALRSNPRDPFNRSMGTRYATAYFVAGRYEDCVAAALETARKMPRSLGTWRVLAAAYGMMDQNADAAEAFEKVKRLQPGISTRWVRAQMPWTEGEHLDRWIEGLQRAGME